MSVCRFKETPVALIRIAELLFARCEAWKDHLGVSAFVVALGFFVSVPPKGGPLDDSDTRLELDG